MIRNARTGGWNGEVTEKLSMCKRKKEAKMTPEESGYEPVSPLWNLRLV